MKKLFTLIASALIAVSASAQGTYKVAVDETHAAGDQVTSVPNITLTFGVAGEADFKAGKATTWKEGTGGYTAFTEGNGVNGTATSGTVYYLEPAEDGTIEVGYVLNASKAFYITEDGVALEDYNGIKLDAKAYAASTFNVKGGSKYAVYCTGSKLGFAGFVYTVIPSGPKANISLTAEVDGNTRTLGFCTLVAGTKINIDWGDGNIVEAGEGVVDDEYQTTADFTGTPVGTGNIKIYAEGITVFDCVSKVDGPSVTALDVTNAPALQYLYANGNVKLETVDLTKSTELLKFSLANNPTKSIDLTNCTKLTRVELQGVAATPGALESIDLTKNTELTYISLNFNNLKSLDLSANAKATSIYALNNQIESVVLPANSACTYISLNNNKLTSFDGANLTAMTKSKGSIFLMNNNISEIKNIATKSLNVTGNKLTISTMPDVANVTTLTNAGQQAMEVVATVTNSIDLSSEADNGNTTYAVYNEDGTAVDAANYTVEGGVITFAEALNGKTLYVAMTNATYKFTGANVLKTTTFAVTVATGINAISNVAPKAVMYNLAGQRVANAKGIVVMNGKKVIK